MDPEERKKLRNRLTSQAYHKVFEKHRPKKSQGIQDPVLLAKMTEEAKVLARSAHKEAGQKFDKEHPRKQKTKESKGHGQQLAEETVLEEEMKEDELGENQCEEEDPEHDPCVHARDVD